MANLCLVTGANGHLGNNLVRCLLSRKHEVRAGVRDLKHRELFNNMDCQVIKADLHDRQSLMQAMKDVDVLFQVAAVYQHWAKDVKSDIIEANLKATKNVIEVAAEAGVSKIVYVSSIAAVDHGCTPINESTWNTDLSNPYYQSKIESEQLAWELAETLQLWMVVVLPSVIIGPNCSGQYTPSMGMLATILDNKLPFDPQFHFNYIDVRDVANGMISAMEKGKHGERYLLANERQTTTTQLFDLARTLFPTTRKPPVVSRSILTVISIVGEFISRFTGSAPPILKTWIKLYHKTNYDCDTSKAKEELGFGSRSPEKALEEAFEYIAKSNLTK